ncbi:MAG: bifunctional diaminohydroxyphosphoribosylaminopyrimidine deaminase/5-amino-6-(5-phosphoribosylamino)uracil reductase RibD [Pirellulales bacterium]
MSDLDRSHMARALELARRGEGFVEPNPMVGCVIAHAGQVVGEGWHQRFGGPHAEVEALSEAGDRAGGATLYVTLEPCGHYGKTPPCTTAILDAGIGRVVCAMRDPFPAVSGRGITELQTGGVQVDVGPLEDEARRLNAPYLKLLGTGRPWILAKWAMTLDGRIATRAGESRWISGLRSRAVVHRLRGRVDAVIVGSGTAQADDPLLSARPPGPRKAARIVVDSRASLTDDSRLVRTVEEGPVVVAVGSQSTLADRERLQSHGCEVLLCDAATHAGRLGQLLDELGHRRMTNVLVEGGSRLLGTLFDLRAIDEVHVFVAPKLLGGATAVAPISGQGIEEMSDALHLIDVEFEQVGDDLYLRGRLSKEIGG